MTVRCESMNRKKSPCVSDCHARSLRGCKSVLLFFCILRAKRGCCGVIVVGKGNVASIGSVATPGKNACYVTFPHYYDTTTPPFCPQNAKKKIRGRFRILSMTMCGNQTHAGSFSCSWIRRAPSMAPSTMGKYSSGQSCSL